MKKTAQIVLLFLTAFALLCGCTQRQESVGVEIGTLTEDEIKAAVDYYPNNEEALRAGDLSGLIGVQKEIVISWRALKGYFAETYPETAYELGLACAATPGIPGGSDKDTFYVRMADDTENTVFEVAMDEQGNYTVTYDGYAAEHTAETSQGSKE